MPMTDANVIADKDYERALEMLESDVENGLKLMKEAEQRGSPLAIYFMGTEFYVGDILPKNEKEARMRFERLREMGYPNMMEICHEMDLQMGYCCLNRRKAFQKMNGDTTTEELGEIMRRFDVPDYDIGAAGALLDDDDFERVLEEEDERKASSMVSSIARRNGVDELFMNKLFLDYLIGTGRMGPDGSFDLYIDILDMDDDAKETFEMAKDGDPDAQYELGMRYRHGDGVFSDEHESFKWLEMAAENGHVEAMYEVATCFDLGMGVSENEEAAMEWYRKAADRGHEHSKEIVGRNDY